MKYKKEEIAKLIDNDNFPGDFQRAIAMMMYNDRYKQ